MSESVDIMQEIMDLFERETLIAFADFACVVDGSDLSGLCKISQSGEHGSEYFSLDFVYDAPEGVDAALVDAALEALGPRATDGALAGVRTITLLPATEAGQGTFVKHVDVLLNPGLSADRRYADEVLCPAIASITSLRFGDLVWWDDAADVPTCAEDEAAFLDRVRASFRATRGEESPTSDLLKDMVDLFERESLVACFDFICHRQHVALSGICKIARSGVGETRYFSLDFLIDSMPSPDQHLVDGVLEGLGTAATAGELSGVKAVALLPALAIADNAFVKHVDVLLSPGVKADAFYVRQTLCPAIEATTTIRSGEVLWLGDIAENKPLSEFGHVMLKKLKKHF